MRSLRIWVVCLFLVLVALLGCSGRHQQSNASEQPSMHEPARATPAAQPIPHENAPAEVWNASTPVMRRSILANYIQKTWKNVRVENYGVTMTITHSGMDEQGAKRIIDDIGKLARAAG